MLDPDHAHPVPSAPVPGLACGLGLGAGQKRSMPDRNFKGAAELSDAIWRTLFR
jgi:hypothetical protein